MTCRSANLLPVLVKETGVHYLAFIHANQGVVADVWIEIRVGAAPIILAGIRISVIINIGTATIGSTVGALTLGTPIFDGLVANKLPFVLEGAVLVALFAILTDMLLERLDQRLRATAD